MGRTVLCRMFSDVPDLCSLDVGDSAPGGTTKNISRHCKCCPGQQIVSLVASLVTRWPLGWRWSSRWNSWSEHRALRGWSPSWKPTKGGQQQRVLRKQVDGGLWPSAQWVHEQGGPGRRDGGFVWAQKCPHPHTKADPATNTAEHPVCLQQRPQPHLQCGALLEGNEAATRGTSWLTANPSFMEGLHLALKTEIERALGSEDSACKIRLHVESTHSR